MHANLGMQCHIRPGSVHVPAACRQTQHGVQRVVSLARRQQQQQLKPGQTQSQRRDGLQRTELETQQDLQTDVLPVAPKQQQPQQPDPQQRRGPLRWLKRNVSRLPFFAKAAEGQDARLNIRALLQQLRVLILGCMMGCVLLVVRYSILHQARTAPREVLYSDFVTLLDSGKVKAARLEASSSKLMFEMHPQEAAAAAGSAAAAAAPSGKAGSSSKASAAAAAAAPAAAADAADAAAPAAPTPHRRFYIKLADKQDPLLVGKVLQAGERNSETAWLLTIYRIASTRSQCVTQRGLGPAVVPLACVQLAPQCGARTSRMFLMLVVGNNSFL